MGSNPQALSLLTRNDMFKFSKSKFAKATSAFVSVMTVALMLGPVTASAAALSAGQIQSILSLLQSFGADQATINNVSASLNGQPTTGTTPSTSGSGYQFKTDLTLGAKGADVIALQDILIAGGYLTMPAGVAKGYFGTLTQSAVAKWQAAAGITPAAGYVGPKSRAALNAMGGSSTTGSTGSTGTTPVAG
jgi:peptidoglycan hydrolase-like protein with peptidoglycan-binding domain